MELDFKGVDQAKGKPMTVPGTIGLFTITAVKFDKSKEKQTPYMEVTFDHESDGTQFRHSFYLSQKALPRIQHLIASATGSEITEKITHEILPKKLMGKKIGLKVLGEISNKGKGFPTISYSGFATSPEEVQFLSLTSLEKEACEAAKEAMKRSTVENADTESGDSSAAPVQDDSF